MDTTTKTWPTAREMTFGWTATVSRPSPSDGLHPDTLRVRREVWDRAEADRQRNETAKAERQSRRDAERQAERDRYEAEQRATQQAQRGEDEATLRCRFIAAGGTESEWGAEKDAVIAEHRRRQVLTAETTEDRLRRASADRYRSTF
jgi:hypothetical protein